MAPRSLVEQISRTLKDLGGEARLTDIQNRVLPESGETTSSRSQRYQRISYTIRQHAEGRGSDRFEKVDAGRYRLKDAWLYQSPFSEER